MLSRLGQPTVAPTLLGIPQDCRETILEMILQNKPLAWNDTVIDDEVPVIQLNIPRVSGEDTRVPQYTISKDKIRVGNVKILAVCRQLHSEGAPIPYGRNSFVSYSFPHLKFRLSAVIGCRNMKFIRKLTLGLPLKHKSDPTIHLGGFLEFLKEKLPNLSELVLTTQFSRLGKVFVKNSADTRLGEEYRAMLNTSAWITCRHPQLRKAIWLAASGPVWKLHVFTPVLREGEIGSDDGYGDFANHNIRITHNPEEIFGNKAPSESTEKWIDTVLDDELSDYVDMCSLTVKILAEDRRHIIRKQPKISILPEIKKVTASVGAHSPIFNSIANIVRPGHYSRQPGNPSY